MKKIIGTLRTHWKKSLFAAAAVSYGVVRADRKRRDDLLMRGYCLEAARMGERPAGVPYRVTVILNPAAAYGKAREKYESYCAPLLHLAGIKTSVVRTEGVGQAKILMGVMDDADAVLVAGGDGTLMEAVTGLLRRPDADRYVKTLPVGVLPVGTDNKTAKSLFPIENEVGLMAEATMSVLKQLFRPADVLQVQSLDDEEARNIYGLREFQIGAFRDAHKRLSKFWYFGGLREAAAYFFSYTTAAKEVCWEVAGRLKHAGEDIIEETKKPESSSWFFRGSPKVKVEPVTPWISLPDYKGSEVSVSTDNNGSLGPHESSHDLQLRLGPATFDLAGFIREGLNREKGDFSSDSYSKLTSKTVRFVPDSMREGTLFSLDDENVELRGGLEMKVLPDKIFMFCSPEVRYDFVLNDSSKKDLKWWQRNKSNKFAIKV